ncbi:hypothetical protein P6P90_15380 [Ectobacillus antri]|jgi:hypothetical protein|uniref:SseB protein N-terminal domain-containing protein n=1 Tax=Ectobacillus antri TaxID=2486280 RepID=A0ABT6H924_9BACI|nr:hypothetical protein [Ectobacillus antri]MDG4658182.1 hypothetical protein [Ectobacillus antri]MDG5755298.1 hypothetical protein [Ectobacillus antri]
MSKQTLQQQIAVWQEYTGDDREVFYTMYEDVLRNLLTQDEIYTIMGPEADEAELANETAPMFCGLNAEGVPSFWLFSEREIAETFARYYSFEKNERPLVRRIKLDEITLTLYSGMFSGVAEVMIDEGSHFVRAIIYDVVNQCFVVQGEEPILEKEEYVVMQLLNDMRYGGKEAFVLPSREKVGDNVMFSLFVPYIEEDTVVIFTDEAAANAGRDRVAARFTAPQLAEVIRRAHRAGATRVVFDHEAFDAEISASKLINILNRMEL